MNEKVVELAKRGGFITIVSKFALKLLFGFVAMWGLMTFATPEADGAQTLHNALLLGSVFVPLFVAGTVIFGFTIPFGELVATTLQKDNIQLKWALLISMLVLFLIAYSVATLVYQGLVYEPILDMFQIPYIPGPKFW